MEGENLTEKIPNEAVDLQEVETVKKTASVLHASRFSWRNIIVLIYLHISSLYGLYLAFTAAKWETLVYVFALYVIGRFGVTAGIHRYWSHRSYKANSALRALLMFCCVLSFEGKVFIWARDHRVHHKYQETEADPHNICKGFWYAHVGWLLQRKNPIVVEKGKGINISDLTNDKLLMFQNKHFWPLAILICFIPPTFIPMYFWGESLVTAWNIGVCLRIVFSYNSTWLINSAAHMYGNRPYDKKLLATQNSTVSLFTLGEGWHNYHHAFPYDYKAAELGKYGLNLTTAFIDFFAKIGWAYELKTVPLALVLKRALKTGDGTYKQASWGWNDQDLPSAEREEVLIYNKKDY